MILWWESLSYHMREDEPTNLHIILNLPRLKTRFELTFLNHTNYTTPFYQATNDESNAWGLESSKGDKI